jgi:hypothetical protein
MKKQYTMRINLVGGAQPIVRTYTAESESEAKELAWSSLSGSEQDRVRVLNAAGDLDIEFIEPAAAGSGARRAVMGRSSRSAAVSTVRGTSSRRSTVSTTPRAGATVERMALPATSD